MKFSFLKDDVSSFYEVTNEEIEELECTLKVKLPKELKELYIEVGYGFVDNDRFNANRIMDTFSVIDFRFRNDEYSRNDISVYDDYEEGKLIFFERNESSYISVELTDSEESKVYYYDIEIASSLKNFFMKMKENNRYFMDDVIKELEDRKKR